MGADPCRQSRSRRHDSCNHTLTLLPIRTPSTLAAPLLTCEAPRLRLIASHTRPSSARAAPAPPSRHARTRAPSPSPSPPPRVQHSAALGARDMVINGLFRRARRNFLLFARQGRNPPTITCPQYSRSSRTINATTVASDLALRYSVYLWRRVIWNGSWIVCSSPRREFRRGEVTQHCMAFGRM